MYAYTQKNSAEARSTTVQSKGEGRVGARSGWEANQRWWNVWYSAWPLTRINNAHLEKNNTCDIHVTRWPGWLASLHLRARSAQC